MRPNRNLRIRHVTVDAKESHASHGNFPNTLRSVFDEIPIRSAAEPSNEVIVGGRRSVTATIARLAHLVEELRGWQRRGLALTCGVAAGAALPPLHLLPLLVPAFTALVWLCNGSCNSKAPWRSAFAVGWWFGFGSFIAGLYWIAEALLIDPGQFGWMMPFAVFGLPALLAVFPAAVTLLLYVTGIRGVAQILLFAILWTAMEWARGHVLTGFLWNLVGYVWTVSDSVSQLAAVTGVWGLSFLTILVAAMPAILAHRTRSIRARWCAVASAAALLGGVCLGGVVRLHLAPSPDTETTVPGVKLRLVQANIAQELKWRPDQAEAILKKYLQLSTGLGFETVTDIIWPETAIPFSLWNDPGPDAGITKVVPRQGLLITGYDRITPQGQQPFRVWNSFASIDPAGHIAHVYDKHHLVPFGEFVPFRALLSIAKITEGDIDFTPGDGPRTVSLAGLPPVSPLICFEAIFPDQVVAVGDRPHWLLNVTNDAWFGSSSGPYQHFQMARMRAIEQGLPLVRVAVTGISAVIDPYGRIIKQLSLGQEGVVDAALPGALPHLTPYARLGDRVLFGLLLVTSLAAAAIWKKSRTDRIVN
jgi:apolipoprotein N-acyltransferase